VNSDLNNLPYNPNDSDSIERYNNRKLTADKIRQILSKVRNNAGDSARRWIWELMQNAKDVPNKFGGVSVEIEHLNDQLKFSHNGNPFTLAHLHSLVQQVSSKSSTNDDEAVTGKFGTGFIATHLLSPKITVEGIVELNNEYRDIDMLLDREGDSSEELIKKISFALDRLKQTDNQEVFKPCYRINQMQKEEALLTSFTYKLNTPEARKAATNGIKDIVETLPIALLTNGGKIKQVRVVDESGTVTYRRGNPIAKGSGIKSIEVLITGDNIEDKTPTQMLYAYDSVGKEITLITEVAVDGHTKLVPIRSTTPMLYRDFPLIGSEKFHFPFIINGKDFNPTEDRNGIVLHAKEDNDAITNRLRIEEAFATAKKFTTSLIEIGIDNRYLLAKTRLPNEKWDNDFSKEWYNNLQEDYRTFLVDLPLVKVNEDGSEYNSLRNVHLPSYGGSNEIKLEFYDLVKPLVGSSKVPVKHDLIDWLECTGPLGEIENWSVNMRFKLHDLLEELKELETLVALQQKLENVDAISWLKSLYSFLVKENETELFQEYAIVPNCDGLLLKVEENKLYKENLDDPLSDHFLDILKDADPESDWRKILVDRRIKNLPFVTQKKGLSNLSSKLNNKLGDRTDAAAGSRFNLSFFQREDCAQIVGRILRSQKQNATGNSLRSRLYDHVHHLFGWEKEPIITENLDSFVFTPAIRLLIHLVNKKIQDSIDLSGLARKLSFSKDETIDWLNKYLQVLQEAEEFRGELETGKIFLNQYQQFDFITNLQDPGTEEYPLPTDLISVLHGLDSNKDWAAELIDSRIKVRRGSAKTFDELGTTLIEVVNSILGQMPEERELTFAEKGESLNTLVEWAENNKDLSTKFLKSFERQSKNLFFDLNFGGGKLRISDMKMLKEDGVVDLLGKIKSSELSTAQVESLINIVTPETLDTVLSQAEDLKAEADHKKAMLKIGIAAEKAIEIAIQQHIPQAKVNRPRGIRRSFDIRITNPKNNKKFDVEIKSYAQGRGDYFLFAPKQAERAIRGKRGFAICLMERRRDAQFIDESYVREHLKTCRIRPYMFQQGYDDYLMHDEIKDRAIDPSKLAITILGSPRVKVNGTSLRERERDFFTLINDIRVQLL
jgi:hypothetical protein